MFFECNLSIIPPAYLPEELRKQYVRIVDALHRRHERLQKALELSGMQPELFQKYAADLFQKDKDGFDRYSPEDIARYAMFFRSTGEVLPERPDWNAVVLFDTAFASVSDWELIRMIGIGGSDRAILMGKSPWRNARDLRFDKRGEYVDDSDKSIFDQGHAEESRVVRTFCKKNGAVWVNETRMFRSKQYPNCTANPDAIVLWPNGEYSIFEAKTSNHRNYPKWDHNKIPEHYVPQMRHYAGVLNDRRITGIWIGCIFMRAMTIAGTYVGSEIAPTDFVCRYMERDVAGEQNALQVSQAWWDRYVVAGEEIPAESEHDIKTSIAIAGAADPKLPAIELTGSEYQEACSAILRKKAELDELTKTCNKLKEEIAILGEPLIKGLGEHTAGTVKTDNGNFILSFKGRETTTVDRELLGIMAPQIVDAVVKKKMSARTLTVKQEKT